MSNLPTENVQNYPRPPALEQVSHRLLVRLGGQMAADTNQGYRVLETHHAPTYYFPPIDVLARLESASGRSLCEWKGLAGYFDVICGTANTRRAAWVFEEPSTAFQAIAGYVAFYAGPMEACFVGDEQVIPQPEDFYGGWVTTKLRGVPKGARGTEHW